MRKLGVSVAFALVVCALFACKKSGSSSQAGSESQTVAPTPGVVFSKKIRPVGNRRTEEFSSDMAFDVTAKQAGVVIRRMAVKKIEGAKRKVEILSTSDTATMKIRVEYLEAYTGESTTSKEPVKRPMSVSGKIYDAEASGGKILVTRVGGGNITPAEKKKVSKDFDNLGKPDRMSAFIPNRPLLPDEKFTVSADAVQDLFGDEDDDEIKIDRAEFTFRSTAPKDGKTLGTFDSIIKVLGDSKKEDMTMRMDFAGKITMDTKNAWPHELSLKGPITLKGKSSGITIEGTGNASISLTSTYQD